MVMTLKHAGCEFTVKEWSEVLGLSVDTIYGRMDRFGVDRMEKVLHPAKLSPGGRGRVRKSAKIGTKASRSSYKPELRVGGLEVEAIEGTRAFQIRLIAEMK